MKFFLLASGLIVEGTRLSFEGREAWYRFESVTSVSLPSFLLFSSLHQRRGTTFRTRMEDMRPPLSLNSIPVDVQGEHDQSRDKETSSAPPFSSLSVELPFQADGLASLDLVG